MQESQTNAVVDGANGSSSGNSTVPTVDSESQRAITVTKLKGEESSLLFSKAGNGAREAVRQSPQGNVVQGGPAGSSSSSSNKKLGRPLKEDGVAKRESGNERRKRLGLKEKKKPKGDKKG